MCATCIDGCISMCDIGKSAYRGTEVIYPQPFGIISSAGEKEYPVDLSHFTILGTMGLYNLYEKASPGTQTNYGWFKKICIRVH